MKILVGNKGNVDFDAPVPMNRTQQELFIAFMKSIFRSNVVYKKETNEFCRVDRIGDHLFQREWTGEEIVVLLDVHIDANKASEMLGRTWMSVIIKRGEVIPDLMRWANLKGYDLAKGDIRKIIEEYLIQKKDLAKDRHKSKSTERKKINALVDEYNRNLSLLNTIDFRTKAGFKHPNDDETTKKTKDEMKSIENELSEKYSVTLEII